MGAFLRQIVETQTEMTEFLLSVAKRGAKPRYARQRDRSDGEVVMSDLATTISDLGAASAGMIKKQSAERDPRGNGASSAESSEEQDGVSRALDWIGSSSLL